MVDAALSRIGADQAVCVCVCVRACVRACVCVSVIERERESEWWPYLLLHHRPVRSVVPGREACGQHVAGEGRAALQGGLSALQYM